MSGISGIAHVRVVRALQRHGFWVLRQGKHIVMTDGVKLITIPRHNPVNSNTLAGIVRDAGLTENQFRKFL